MRKILGNEHSAIAFAESSIRKAYGEDRARYSKVTGSESSARLRRIELGVDALLNSKYSTAVGRKQMHREQIDTLVRKLSTEEKPFTRKQAELMLDVFYNKEWEKIRSRSGSDGSGVDLDALENMVRSKFSEDDIVYIMNDYLHSGKVKSFIQYTDRVQKIMSYSTKENPISPVRASEALLNAKGDISSAMKLLRIE